MHRETKQWRWTARLALLVALAMSLAGCFDLSEQEATRPVAESLLETPLANRHISESPLGTPTLAKSLPTEIPTATHWNYFPTLTAQARITPTPFILPTVAPPTPRITPTHPKPPKTISPYDPRVPLRAEGITLASLRSFDTQQPITFRAWSPDGEQFLFSRTEQTYILSRSQDSKTVTRFWPDLWVMNVDGTNQRKLAEWGGTVAWSPDGSSVAYLTPTQEEGIEGRLEVVDVKRLEAREVAACDLGDIHDVAWLPTGEIVCRKNGVMHALKSNGSAMRQLNSIFSSESVTFSEGVLPPVFQGRYLISPDGSRMFYLKTGKEPGLWVSSLDGSNAVEIEGRLSAFPVWSPDSNKLAYGILNGNGRLGTDLWVVNADGSNPHPVAVAEDEDAQCLDPTWSPDGKVIAYTYKANQPSQPESVWVVNVDGTESHLLVDLAFAPQWSPRGNELAVLRRRAAFDDPETLLIFLDLDQ